MKMLQDDLDYYDDMGIMDDSISGSKGGMSSGERRSQKSKSSRKSLRGFASMDEKKQRKIASKGGKAAHKKGTAHEWTSDEAKTAGRLGGQH